MVNSYKLNEIQPGHLRVEMYKLFPHKDSHKGVNISLHILYVSG